MNKKIELISQESKEVISLLRAKKFLRVEHSYDDDLIQEMLNIAVIAGENYLGMNLINQNWKMTFFNNLSRIVKFTQYPLLKINSIKLIKHNQEEVYLNQESYYINEHKSELILNREYCIKSAEINYIIGFKDIPSLIIHAILEHLVKMYDLRGADQSLPFSARTIYQKYRRVRL